MKMLEIAGIALFVAFIDAFALYCCCKVAKKENEMITLTDIDGVKFDIYTDMIISIINKGQYREVTTYIGEVFRIRETLPELVSKGLVL